MNNNLPVYKLVLKEDDTDTGVSAIALVDFPAIDIDFQAFSATKNYKFKIENEEKRIVSGALMVADMPIYRADKSGEYYVTVDKDTINKIVQRYFKNKNTDSVNLMHDSNQIVDGVYMFESFIVDSERGIKPPKGFEKITEGSWFGSFKVENDEVWNQIKAGEFKGFSIEGMFSHEFIGEDNAKKLEKEHNILSTFKTEIMNIIDEIKTLKKELFNQEAPAEQKHMDAKLADGTIIQIDGELAEGSAVSVVAEDGTVTPAPDGDLTMEDGSVITVAGGVITAIKEAPESEDGTAPIEEKKNEFASKEEFANIVSKLESFEVALAELKEKFEKEVASKSEFAKHSDMQKLFELIEKVADMPKEQPTEKPQSFKKPSALEKIIELKKQGSFKLTIKNK